MSDTVRAQMEKAYRMIKGGQKDEAVEILMPLIEVDDENHSAWWLLANALYPKSLADVEIALENILVLRPKSKRALKMLAHVKKMQSGEDDDPFANIDLSDKQAKQPAKPAKEKPVPKAAKPKQPVNSMQVVVWGIGVVILLLSVAGIAYGVMNIPQLKGQEAAFADWHRTGLRFTRDDDGNNITAVEMEYTLTVNGQDYERVEEFTVDGIQESDDFMPQYWVPMSEDGHGMVTFYDPNDPQTSEVQPYMNVLMMYGGLIGGIFGILIGIGTILYGFVVK